MAAAIMSAQDASGPASSTTGVSTAMFNVRTANGEGIAGSIDSWTSREGLSIRPTGALPRAIPTADVVDVRPRSDDHAATQRIAPPTAADSDRDGRARGHWLIGTSDGDLLCGDIADGDETSAAIRDAAFGLVRVSLDRILFIVRRDGDPVADGAQPSAASSQDQITLRNGDRAVGIVDRIDATSVSVQTGRQRRVLRWPVVQALRLANTGAGGAKQDAGGMRIRWADARGSVLIARAIDWRGGEAALTRADGSIVRASAASMRGVQVLGGRWRWLSELDPAFYESVPYLDLRWPLARDRNVLGGPLRVAGVTAARGLGLHAAARVRWDLAAAYERFSARVGIDDSGGRCSDAAVELRLDDRTVARFEHVRWGQPALPIDLDVTAARRLELIVDFGDNGDVQDRVDLLDAALVKRR